MTTGKKRQQLVNQEPQMDAEGVQRTHKANNNHKEKRRQVTPEEDREEEHAQATSTTPGICSSSDGTDHHCAEGATIALVKPNSAAGSPITKLPLEMVHTVLAQVNNLDLPACLLVCHTWRNAITDRVRCTWRGWQHMLSEQLAANRQLAVLQWAHLTLGIPWGRYTCSKATHGGHLNVLQWVHSEACQWDENMCGQAAQGSHLSLLQWACTQGCLWDKDTCSQAVQGGHLDLLKWSHTNSCLWDAYTCSKAALQGHSDLLKWARAQGCLWDSNTCSQAAQGSHLGLLQWPHSGLSVVQEHMQPSSARQPLGPVEVGARSGLSMG